MTCGANLSIHTFPPPPPKKKIHQHDALCRWQSVSIEDISLLVFTKLNFTYRVKFTDPENLLFGANSLYVSLTMPSKIARSEKAKPARKQNLTRNSQSRSFEVTHFGINEKQTMDCVSLYNNAGIISKVSEDISREKAENLSTTLLSFDAPSPGNLREYSHKPYVARN